MRVEQISPGMARISLAWGNTYVLTDAVRGKEAILIDCGLRQDRADLLAGLRTLGLEPAHVRTVLLTHAHCDHAGNAAYFAEQGANIVLHKQEARFLWEPRSYAFSGWKALRRPFTTLTFLIGEILYPVERVAAVQTVGPGDILAAPGGPLQVIASPGHSPGHISFYRAHDGVLFSGDAILNIVPNLLPALRRTDLCLPPAIFSDDMAQVRDSAKKLVELSPRVLLSGHGLPLTENTAQKLRAWAGKTG